MAPKKKGTKIALSDFLQDDKLGSWADEMDALPTAPAPRADGDRDGDFMSRTRDRESGFSGPPRDELPLPTQAPYTAFLGNLAFDVGESEVNSFFSGLKLVSVKIIMDLEGKPKGFGYVEFGSLDHLKDGLSRSGEQLAGRTVRVSVAEPPKSAGSRLGGKDAFSESFQKAEESSQWRRSGPLPPLPPSSSGGMGRSSSNFGSPSIPESERDWSAARGSKFVPSADTSPRPGFAPPRTGGFVSENAAKAEAAHEWRSSKPLATGPPPPSGGYREAPPHQRGGAPFREAAPAGPADTEEQWTRGGKFVPSVDRSNPASRRTSSSSEFGQGGRGAPAFPPSQLDDSPSDWRSKKPVSSGVSSRQGSMDRSPTPSSPQPPSRRPLTLLPRTASTTATIGSSAPTSPEGSVPASPSLSPAAAVAAAPAPSSKASPFGAARPVDNAAKEREVEEKLKAQREALAKKQQDARDAKLREKEKAVAGGGAVVGGARGPPERKPLVPVTATAPEGAAAVVAPVELAPPAAPVLVSGASEEQMKTVPVKSGGALGGRGKEEKEEKKVVKSAFAGLEIEGGEDEDEEEDEELAKKVGEVKV